MIANPIASRIAAIRAALMRGEADEAIAARLGTTSQAVRVVRKGLGSASSCPWTGRFASMDGTNVSGWSRRRGEPRLVQTLAICRFFARNGVRFTCWFDANFRWCLKQYSEKDAQVLDLILREEPDVFKQAPAGADAQGNRRRADPYVIRDAESVPGGLLVTDDLYRAEAESNPLFGWTQTHSERRIVGQIAVNGDVLLGDNGRVRISVSNDPEFYIR